MISDRAKEIHPEGVSETENRNLIFLEEGGQSTIFRLFRASEQAGDPEQRAIRWLGMAKGLCRCARGELQTGMIRSRDEMSVMATVSGAAICRAIVEAHGGWLRDHGPGPEPGPRFTLTVPAGTAPAGGQGANTGNTGRGASASPMQRSREGQLRVLAVDPDPVSRSHTWTMLLEEGFEAVVTGDPDRVEYLAGTERPHLFLVDAGPEIMERIARESDGPVLFMLEHGTVPDMERALDLGAADFILKPFTRQELAGRIRTAVRRGREPVQPASPGPFVLGELTIDYAERTATVANVRVQLTATEFNLLSELSTNAGVTLTHEHLLREVWGPLHQADVRVLRTFIKGGCAGNWGTPPGVPGTSTRPSGSDTGCQVPPGHSITGIQRPEWIPGNDNPSHPAPISPIIAQGPTLQADFITPSRVFPAYLHARFTLLCDNCSLEEKCLARGVAWTLTPASARGGLCRKAPGRSQSVAGLVNLPAKGKAELKSSHGRSLGEFVPLRLLLDRKNWTTTQLSQVLPVRVSRISRAVNKPVRLGPLARRYPGDDRRMVLPELTKNGRALTRWIHQRGQECEAALFKDTSEEEMAVFLQVTLRATGQRVNAVQVSPGKHPSVGTGQSVSQEICRVSGPVRLRWAGGPDGL